MITMKEKRKKILIVDDEFLIRKNLVEILEYENYEVVEAKNGWECIEKAKDLHPDLILCDIIMPGLDGEKTFVKLKEDSVTALIPFIFLTVKSKYYELRHGMNLGADDYIIKPFTIHSVVNTVKSQLEKQERIVGHYAKKTQRITHQRLKNLLVSSPAVIYSYQPDKNYDLNFVSDNIVNLIGYTSENFFETPDLWYDNLHPQDKEEVFHSLANFFENGYGVYEYRFKHKDGNYRWIYDERKLILDPLGDPLEIVGACLEITKTKQVQNQLQGYTEEMKAITRAMAHHLKEPLRKISVFSSRLEKDVLDKMPEKARDDFQRLLNSTDRLQELGDDLLTVCDVLVFQDNYKTTDMNKVVAKAIDELQEKIQATKAQIEVGPLPIIEGDSRRLRQLIRGLLSNSLKFQEKDKIPKIKISSQETESGFVNIKVEDNGIGFEEQYLNKIFKAFERLHHPGKYRGTGIGLTICKHVVQKHRGEIKVISKPGQGTCFCITLPKKQLKDISIC